MSAALAALLRLAGPVSSAGLAEDPPAHLRTSELSTSEQKAETAEVQVNFHTRTQG